VVLAGCASPGVAEEIATPTATDESATPTTFEEMATPTVTEGIATPTATDEAATPSDTAVPTSASTLRVEVVETATFQGVIFSAEAAQERGLDFLVALHTTQFWTPSVAQVTALEVQVLPFLRTDERLNDGIGWRRTRPLEEALPDFTRQYLGYQNDNGDELIYASYLCNAPLDELTEHWAVVMDGGDCYFQVHYNVTTETYESLSVNGEA
jgi:hypothetical protein